MVTWREETATAGWAVAAAVRWREELVVAI
jgi:hypothetical protein